MLTFVLDSYLIAYSTRVRMTSLFRDESCSRWWLPNDEGFTPLLQNIRAFADERNTTTVPPLMENLREIRHVFNKMQIGGSEATDTDDGQSGSANQGKGKGVDS